MRPVEAGARQQPDGAPVQTGVHPIAVELDLVKPIRPLRRRGDQFGELRLYPSGERRRLGAA